MRLIDEQYLNTPFYGVDKMTEWLRRQGHEVNPKRVRRLMRLMGLEAIYPRRKRGLSVPDQDHQGLSVPAQGCCDHPTEPGLGGGYYLYPDVSRLALSDGDHGLVQPLCGGLGGVDYLGGGLLCDGPEAGVGQGRPDIMNTDQGSQFTSAGWTETLRASQVAISMDGKGRVFDNIFVERLWRTVKVEEVYLRDYQTPAEARVHLDRYFRFYNDERLHQSLGYRTPAEVFGVAAGPPVALGLPPCQQRLTRR